MHVLKTTRLVIFLLAISVGCCMYFGCAAFYKQLGYSQIDAEAEAQKDRDDLATAVTEGVAAGQLADAERAEYIQAKLKAARSGLWQALAAGVAAVSGIVTTAFGYLLRRNGKVTAAVITGVEKSNSENVKANIQLAAQAAGVETVLHKQVKALT